MPESLGTEELIFRGIEKTDNQTVGLHLQRKEGQAVVIGNTLRLELSERMPQTAMIKIRNLKSGGEGQLVKVDIGQNYKFIGLNGQFQLVGDPKHGAKKEKASLAKGPFRLPILR